MGSSARHRFGRRFAAGVSAVALLASGLVVASAPAAVAAYPDTFNPFAMAGGFTVYAREDALLQNQETEGSIAVGGTATVQGSSGTYSIIHVAAGTADYALPTVDGDPTRLLVGEYSDASTGILQITSAGTSEPTLQGDLKMVDRRGPFQPFARADFIRLNTNPANVDQTPLIDATHQQYPDDATPPAGAAGNGSIYTANTGATAVADYVEANREATWADAQTCLANLPTTAYDASVDASASAPPDRVVLNPLSADEVNVLDYSELPAGTKLLQFGAGPTPGAANPLVIRVAAGTTSVDGLRIDPQGLYSPYVLWDLSALSGPVAVTAADGGNTRMDGSIYAPNADITVTAAPLDGQVIGQNVTIAGGEVHSFLFAGAINCGGQQSGTFSMQKELAGGVTPNDLPPGTTFTVNYDAQLPDGSIQSGSLDLPATTPATVVPAGVDFPYGTVITFSEITPLDVPGFDWGGVQVPAPVTIPLADPTIPLVVTNTGTATPVGTVSVQKRVVDEFDNPVTPGGTATVDWSATDGQTGTVTLAPNGPAVPLGVDFPLGTIVSFSEDFTPPTGYDWTGATWSPAEAIEVTAAGTTAAVVVTNTVRTSPADRVITIVKSAIGEAADPDYAYGVTYNTDPAPARTERALPLGTPQILDDVETGAENLLLAELIPTYNGTPVAPALWELPQITYRIGSGAPVSVTVSGFEDPNDPATLARAIASIPIGGANANEDIAIRVTNAISAGSFELQKTFAASSILDGGSILATRPVFGFSVDWTASNPDTGVEIDSGTVRLPADGTAVTPVDAAGNPLTFPYGTTITWEEVGAPNIPGIDWGTLPTGELLIGSGGAATVTGDVANTAAWRQGTFQVRKELVGIDASLLPPGTTFTVDYTGRTPLGRDIAGSFEVPADGTPAGPAEQFPVGSIIRMTEAAPDAAALPPGYEWQSTTWSPRSFVVIRNSVTPELTVTNTVEQFTRYSVTKTVAGNAASTVPADTVFGGRSWIDGVAQPDIPIREGETFTSRWLPVGTIVEAQEADFPDIAGVDWGTPVWKLADGTVLEPEPNGRVVLPAAQMGTKNIVALELENQATTPLPPTGGTMSSAIPIGAGAAILVGLALVLRRRPRSQS